MDNGQSVELLKFDDVKPGPSSALHGWVIIYTDGEDYKAMVPRTIRKVESTSGGFMQVWPDDGDRWSKAIKISDEEIVCIVRPRFNLPEVPGVYKCDDGNVYTLSADHNWTVFVHGGWTSVDDVRTDVGMHSIV